MVKHGFERIADGGLVPVEMAAEEVQMKGWLHLENPLGRLFDGETGDEVHDCAEPIDRIGYVPYYRAHPIFEIDAAKLERTHIVSVTTWYVRFNLGVDQY